MKTFRKVEPGKSGGFAQKAFCGFSSFLGGESNVRAETRLAEADPKRLKILGKPAGGRDRGGKVRRARLMGETLASLVQMCTIRLGSRLPRSLGAARQTTPNPARSGRKQRYGALFGRCGSPSDRWNHEPEIPDDVRRSRKKVAAPAFRRFGGPGFHHTYLGKRHPARPGLPCLALDRSERGGEDHDGPHSRQGYEL